MQTEKVVLVPDMTAGIPYRGGSQGRDSPLKRAGMRVDPPMSAVRPTWRRTARPCDSGYTEVPPETCKRSVSHELYT